jgi:predicted DNA-binding transcriptional regulator YafY
METRRVVEPYGLVVKAGVWYLVFAYEDNLRVRRVSKLVGARLTGDHFLRREAFDLREFWEDWCRKYEEMRTAFRVRVRAAPQALSSLNRNAVQPERDPDVQGWLTLDLAFESFEAARERILSLGRAVEVLEPASLRYSVLDFARQVVDFYREKET